MKSRCITLFKISFVANVCFFTLALFLAFGCNKNKIKTPSEQDFEQILFGFIGKTPNQLYAALGQPDEYKVVLGKNNQIAYATANYKYIFDFIARDYECVVSFITDSSQQQIVDYHYNNEKCFYITMY